MTDEADPPDDRPGGPDEGPASAPAPDSPFGLPADEVPDVVAARDHVLDELVRFVRALRRAGAEVPANATLTAARALVEVGFEREAAEPALRAALLTRKDDLATFDRLFAEFWRRLDAGLDPGGPADRPGEDAPDGGLAPLDGSPAAGESAGGDADAAGESEPDPVAVARRSVDAGIGGTDPPEDGEATTRATYSPAGAPGRVDAGETWARDHDVEPAVRRLTRALATLRGRRYSAGGDDRPDARRALRESVGTGGAVVGLPSRSRDPADVRGLLLVDVSQSVLDVLDEGFLVGFLRAVRAGWREAPVFFFDEGVREVSAQFDAPTAADALDALERAEAEWGGGTRIGHAVETVRRDHARAVDRDTVVLVVSDGLEVGDLDDLATGMAWLSRRAAAVLWLNPLAAAPGYEPAAGGMETALPYVDGLFSFSGPDDVAEMVRQLRLRGLGGPLGYRHDPRRDDR